MSTVIKVKQRASNGKGGARQTRRAGMVPGIIYGAVEVPTPIAVVEKELLQVLATAGETALIDLVFEEGKSKAAPTKAIIRDIDFDPRRETPIHIDFLAVAMDKKLTLSVPIELEGNAVGVVVNKGLLSHILYEVEIECLPGNIPHSITINVSALDLGHSIHVKDVAPIEGVRILTSGEQVIVTVEAPRAEDATGVAGEAAAAAEPEVITKKKEEGE
jgi:large subunit ribosomal protein L25